MYASLLFTVPQTACVDAQGVCDAGGGPRDGAWGACRAPPTLGRVGGARRPPGVGEGLPVLCP